jgi:hypothetical protein
MRQGRLITGDTLATILLRDGMTTTSYNWKWEVVRTPEEWWWDYAEAHPDYDPYSLEPEEGQRIYGPQFIWSKAEFDKEWDESQKEDARICSFLINHFGDSFKYILVLTRYRPKHERELKSIEEMEKEYLRVHDPMAEAADVYLHFCRLSRLVDMRWSTNRIINEIAKFVHKYGPPWYAQYAKLHTPPFDDTFDGPLTIDGILWESLKMSLALDAYRMLADFIDDVRAPRMLKKHMEKVYKIHKQFPDFYEVPFVPLSEKPLPLDTESQISKAGTALVIECINEGLRKTGVQLGLTSKLEKGLAVGAWAPKYKFKNLMGAMWLQFYLEILDKGRLKECGNENCRRVFPASRSDKKYCSKECGVKQYMRDHRKQAKKQYHLDQHQTSIELH